MRVSASYGEKYKQMQLVVSPSAAENLETTIRVDPPATSPVAAEISELKPLRGRSTGPEWSLAGWSDGKRRQLSDYRGKVVVLDFWATWCGGCLTAIPEMEQLAKKYEKQDVVFFGVHTPDGDMDQIKKLQKVKGWTAPTAVDVGTSRAGGETIKRYGVRGFPTVMLIAPDGKIAFNGDDRAEDQQAVLARLQKLAESLDVPWPPEKWGEGEEAAKQFNKLIFAMYSAEVDKALAAAMLPLVPRPRESASEEPAKPTAATRQHAEAIRHDRRPAGRGCHRHRDRSRRQAGCRRGCRLGRPALLRQPSPGSPNRPARSLSIPAASRRTNGGHRDRPGLDASSGA